MYSSKSVSRLSIYGPSALRTGVSHTLCKQPFGREVLCKYVWIFHRRMNVQNKIWLPSNINATVYVTNWRQHIRSHSGWSVTPLQSSKWPRRQDSACVALTADAYPFHHNLHSWSVIEPLNSSGDIHNRDSYSVDVQVPCIANSITVFT
jgi:hypothetical protein